MKEIMYGYKVKGSWDFGKDYYNNMGGDLVGAGFSWPPRCYTCSFCKREFRSAQALGGHMNVHRRDKARLRQSPPRDIGNSNNYNPDPNPSFNSKPISSPRFLPSSPSTLPSDHMTKFPHFTSTLPQLFAPSLSPLSSTADLLKEWQKGAAPIEGFGPITTDLVKIKARKGISLVEKINPFVSDKGCETVKKREFVRLDLEIGLTSQSKEELDLELRLGYT